MVGIFDPACELLPPGGGGGGGSDQIQNLPICFTTQNKNAQ